MSLTQFLVLAVIALLVTIPTILLVPRDRTSPAFNRLLWAATALVAFLIAWIAVAMARDSGSLDSMLVADTPLLPAVLGALVGALALNLPLWVLDRFETESAETWPAEADEETARPPEDERPDET
jgi:apolipoprotein N-acyltransferase